ncbi:MAG: M28 family peptidase [Balneolaceae bacterium]|nr:M28 family peptidase [Balneolaceae bacterium]
MNKTLSSLLFLFLFIAACEPQPSAEIDEAAQLITEESLLAHIEVLSSDEFEGRAPATRGEELSVQYLINELEEIGIEPGMQDDSFEQYFPLLGQVVDGQTASITIKLHGNIAEELEYRADFMGWPSNEAEEVDITDAELVYVGYGIQAPEFEWDDYKDADVEGKVLVYKNSDPSHDPDIFEGDSRLYYGRWSYKFEKAEEMGALGAIIIHTDETAGYGWSVVEGSWGRERFALTGDNDDHGERPEFNTWLTEESSSRLFEAAGLDLHDMLDAAADRQFEPVLLEGVTLDVTLNASYSNMSSRNVIGKLEGNDRDLRDEYVIFSAHYDHLGIAAEPVDGDSIFNGAWDNASGTSAVLEIAKALKEVESDLRRSVLFMFVGAEEMGLLGSQYWSQNPTVHPGNVSANINLDSMQIYGRTNDMVLVGYNRNTITDVFREHAEAEGRQIVPDPQPEQGFFYRSDHFSYARVGIPAIFPNPGRDFIEKPDDWAEVTDSVTAANYHALSDEINEYWDMAGMESDTRLILKASFHIINRDEMMEWVPGDEFEAVRQEMMEEL